MKYPQKIVSIFVKDIQISKNLFSGQLLVRSKYSENNQEGTGNKPCRLIKEQFHPTVIIHIFIIYSIITFYSKCIIMFYRLIIYIYIIYFSNHCAQIIIYTTTHLFNFTYFY